MAFDAPHLIFYGLTAVAIVVWLCALQFMLHTTRRRKPAAEAEREFQAMGTTAPESLLVGTAEVAGQPGELSARAAGILAKQSMILLGPVKILEQTDDRLVFEGLQSANQAGKLFGRAELRFSAAPQNRTRIDYAVEVPPRSWLLILGWVFIGLGLLAIITAFTLIQLMVVDAIDPALRWQSIQMIQCVHFLWPPFLFGGIYRRLRTHLQATLDSMIHNLPYSTA
jgi:hypothetical protein